MVDGGRVSSKTEAASRVRQVLQSVKDRLAQPGGSKVNEATTRAHFLNPLLEALGYSTIDDILFEFYLPDGKTFLDYRLVVDGKPRVGVEAKASGGAVGWVAPEPPLVQATTIRRTATSVTVPRRDAICGSRWQAYQRCRHRRFHSRCRTSRMRHVLH